MRLVTAKLSRVCWRDISANNCMIYSGVGKFPAPFFDSRGQQVQRIQNPVHLSAANAVSFLKEIDALSAYMIY